MTSSPVTFAFATPVYYRVWPDEDGRDATLAARIRDLAARLPSDDLARAHHGGFYSRGTFFDEPGPGREAVLGVVRRGIDEYAAALGVAGGVERVELQGWVALTRAGDYQTPHVHAGSMLSGVYYVEVPARPEPEGCIDFVTPVPEQEMTFARGFSRSYCRVAPAPGGLVLFPSYLRHFTHPFEGPGERICVVFNALLRQRR